VQTCTSGAQIKKAVLLLSGLRPRDDLTCFESFPIAEYARSDEPPWTEEGSSFSPPQYHWNDNKKLLSDSRLITAVCESILPDLCVKLNKLHHSTHPQRYWSIVCGLWLRILVTAVADRMRSIQQISTYDYKWIVPFLRDDKLYLRCADTEHFIEKVTESDTWNHAISQRILPSILENFEFDSFEVTNDSEASNVSPSKRRGALVRNLFYFIINIIYILFKGRDRYFLHDTYLGKKSLVKLEILLNQLPVPWSFKFKRVSTNLKSEGRTWTIVGNRSGELLEEITRSLIPDTIPAAFVEGYPFLSNSILISKRRRVPKVIFTSVSHFYNDAFKAYAAHCSEKGTRIFIGEHGGFGAGLINGFHEYERDVADLYFTSGWLATESNDRKVIPLGNIRICDLDVRPHVSGSALLVLCNMPRYAHDIRAMATSDQMLDYFQWKCRFLRALNEGIRRQVSVRLYSKDYGWNVEERLRKVIPDVSIQNPQDLAFNDALRTSRIFIGTYSATAYLDSLTMNFPSILFWDRNIWAFNNEASNALRLLESARIFHSTPEGAAAFLMSVWDDIPSWWESSEVQNARRLFCEKFSRVDKRIVETLAGHLRKAIE
jgi:putative transferase (TIGR04331 family)